MSISKYLLLLHDDESFGPLKFAIFHFKMHLRKILPIANFLGIFRHCCGSIPRCMQNESLSRPDKSLVWASVRGNSLMAAAVKQRRRFFGPSCRTVREDVLAATEVDAHSSDGDFAALAAYRKARKRVWRKKKGWKR